MHFGGALFQDFWSQILLKFSYKVCAQKKIDAHTTYIDYSRDVPRINVVSLLQLIYPVST